MPPDPLALTRPRLPPDAPVMMTATCDLEPCSASAKRSDDGHIQSFAFTKATIARHNAAGYYRVPPTARVKKPTLALKSTSGPSLVKIPRRCVLDIHTLVIPLSRVAE